MNIAVTGATGHVGANLVRTLVEQGHQVRAVVHAGRRGLEGLPITFHEADIRDAAAVGRAFHDIELVYHLAATINIAPGNEDQVYATNVYGVRNVVDSCLKNGVRRLLHFSSIHAFDERPYNGVVDERRPINNGENVPPYDRSKAAGEREVRAGIERGLDAVIVNPTAILGPHDYGPSRMGRVLLDLYHRRLPALIEGGFDWVDVRDVVAGAMAAAEKAKTGEKYLLAGQHHTVAQLAALVEELTGKKAPRLVTPMWLCRLAAPFAQTAAQVLGKEPLFTSRSLHALRNHQQVSHDKAARDLGYQPRPLRDTLRESFDWYRGAGLLS
jgi:dihydroflavonol-4-reductase